MRKLLSVFLCLMIGISLASAQTINVSGVVLSAEDGEPVIGASVVEKGTTNGVVTNYDGHFDLKVEAGAKLVVSYVGMTTHEAVAKPTMKITLESSSKELGEVVVVAYGTVSREAKTGSVTQLKADQIIDVPASSVDKALAGKLAGVIVTGSSGQPGAASNIRIRGTSSINAGNEPLYVVDGVAVMTGDQSATLNTSNAIAMINPNDIESITVLKDAAAASVYGSRAANGVILITTKSGKGGTAKFAVRAKYGVSSLACDNSDFGMMNPSELLDFQRAAIINGGYNPDDPTSPYYRPYEILSRTQTNWVDHLTRLGQMQEYEINAQAGNDKSNYYSSLSYHKNDGVFYGIGFQKMNARINANTDLNKYLKTGVRVNVGYMKGQDMAMQSSYYTNPIFAAQTILPWTPAYTTDGLHNTDIPENSNLNPRATADYNDNYDEQYRFNGNMYLQWTPMKGLVVKTTNAAEVAYIQGRSFYHPYAYNGESLLVESQLMNRLLTTSNTITYSGTTGNHNYRGLLGQEALQRYYIYHSEQAYNIDPSIPYFSSGNTTNDLDYNNTQSTLLSFFGILDYNYAAKYFLQASLRYDGSSKFGAESQWGLFYSVGGSWNIHSESFMEDTSDYLNLLKLRASYGLNGNNNIRDYLQYGVYSQVAYNGGLGMKPSRPANDNLSWEKNGTWNAGVDFGFFGSKLTGSLDFYSRKTTDMLLTKPLSSTSGFTSAVMNIGSMKNTGVELQLDYTILNNKDWTWNVGFNLAHNKSEILDLAGDESIAYSEDASLRHVVGRSLFSFYVRDYYGTNPQNGDPLWRTADGKLTNDLNKANWIYTGSPEPDVNGGFNTDLRWKGISLSAAFEYKVGNEVLIGENYFFSGDGSTMVLNQFKSAGNYWKNPGDTGCNPKPVVGNTSGANRTANSRWIERGDYLRIKDVTLSYEIPTTYLKTIGLSNVRVYASGLNVFTFHDVNFWDPERGVDGVGVGIYPMTKSFILGLDLTF
ncbi:MAG: TonB-dependent receptor [Bacteroidales bacterium]|nr:TonB-dependent receptor [Bacteroidales bacterium]